MYSKRLYIYIYIFIYIIQKIIYIPKEYIYDSNLATAIT